MGLPSVYQSRVWQPGPIPHPSQEWDSVRAQEQSQPWARGTLPGDETALGAGVLPVLDEDFAGFFMWLQSI